MSDKRRNIHFRNPTIYDAFQMLIEKGVIRARSASARTEDLIAADVRRVLPKLRKGSIKIPAEVIALVTK